MDFIKRTFCIDKSYSRLPSLIPPINKTLIDRMSNWGTIPYAVNYKGVIYCYDDLMTKYYYEKKQTAPDINYIKFVDRINGKFEIPDNVINGALNIPKEMFYAQIPRLIELIDHLRQSKDCCSLLEYEKYIGDNNLYLEVLEEELFNTVLKEFFVLKDKFNKYEENIFVNFMKQKLLDLPKELEFIDSVLVKNKLSGGVYKFPYLNVSLSINTSYRDMGIMTDTAEEWVKGRRYYKGEIVLFQNKTYTLRYNIGDEGYAGFFDSKYKEIYFDDFVNGQIYLNHWTEYVEKTHGNKTNIKSLTNSKLSSLARFKNSVDDDGYELPGIYNSDLGNDLELVYKEGIPINIKQVGNVWIADMILKINFDNLLNKIEFKYVIGGEFTRNNSGYVYKDNTGIIYNEEYTAYITTGVFKINGNNLTVSYCYIDFNSKKVQVYENDINFLNKNVILSNIEYKGDTINDNELVTNNLIREEYKMGVGTPTFIEGDIYIDRGINDAFERHLKLGEIKTLEDMVNYGNASYFKTKEN